MTRTGEGNRSHLGDFLGGIHIVAVVSGGVGPFSARAFCNAAETARGGPRPTALVAGLALPC